MSKADWGKPAYQGRPDPRKVANRFMLVLVLLLLAGFVRLGIKNNWFTPMIEFILS
ncbi:MAG: hypothetical protein PHI66_05155 [Candidatus Pacebacteria bacterium]|nr:hypothetical protein [Candidatus Paceibacterota bacterium]